MRDSFADEVRRVVVRHLPDHFPSDLTFSELGFDPFWHLLVIADAGVAGLSEDEISSWRTLGDIQRSTRHGPAVIIVHQHGIAVRIDATRIHRQTLRLPPGFQLNRLGVASEEFATVAAALAERNGYAPLCVPMPQTEWVRWQTLEDILASADRYRYWSP